MLRKCAWLLCLATVVISVKPSPQGVQKDQSFLRFYSSAHTPRSQWVYRPQEEYRQTSDGNSHGYALYPYGSTHKTAESSYDQSVYPTTSREYWRPGSTNTNYTSYYGYSRPGYFGSASGSGSASYQDSIQGSHSLYQYQQMRPSLSSYTAYKKTPLYHMKGKLQVQSLDLSGKPKYKKTPISYKAVYPRVHKPYAKHKYPAQKIVQPSYRRYYTSPYQRYSIAPSEMLRFRVKTQSDGLYKASTASPTPSNKHHTTERMDDAYPDGSLSDDYSTYNDTHNAHQNSYYEVDEDSERASSGPEEGSYDESTTRGYYGDRIYMSTQVPLITSDKTAVKNKYFIIRRTSDDDDIETIFE